MKIFKAIRQAEQRRVPARIGRVSAVSLVEPLGSLVDNCHWRVAHEVTVRFEATGPEAALPDMHKRAQRAIASEVFGDLECDMRDLKHMLWEEDFYRYAGDPVLAKVEAMMLKMRGHSEEAK